jgi:Protein of unknown function (DUF3102)
VKIHPWDVKGIAMTAVAPPAGVGSNSLPELAGRIVREHEAIQNAPHVVPRAIALGNLLIEAKNHDGQYGKWATWLKENCKEMSDRTAQRYINLAVNQKKLEEIQQNKSTSEIRHTVADLTLNEACRLISTPKEVTQKSPHNKYVAAEDRLIERLVLLGSPVAIREAAEITQRRLRAAVADLTNKANEQQAA